ncbi:MAG: hypothetical protein NW207_03705 [Cytophagales bacterium]|nr:hypothetical protein [Cytophagales bacterium]
MIFRHMIAHFFIITASFIILFINYNACSQSVYVPYSHDYYFMLDRYEIKYASFSPTFHTTFKPYTRMQVASFADSTAAILNVSKADLFNIQYLANDNWDYYTDSTGTKGNFSKPIFNIMYKKHNTAYHVKGNNFNFLINPVLLVSQNTINKDYPLSLNTRGAEVRGMIANRIGFYTFITDNQAFFPDYVRQVADSIKAVPNEGFTKYFKDKGYDFFTARGYISFNVVKPIHIQLGHDKNFIGNGYRSIFLSDYSSKYFFLRINTKFWKINYNNLFIEGTAQVINQNNYNPRKYMAAHHLSFNFTKNINVGLFEIISFRRSDTATGNTGFELNYLNPVIFLREAESYLGSYDKTGAGIDFKINMLKHISVYGQWLFNEFSLKNLIAQKGWWGNKYAWQIGMKYIDVAGIKNLDLQLENNFVRPFVYADNYVGAGFYNYGQPIAHPLGANFNEYIAILRYQPMNRLNICAKAFYITKGEDPPGENWGGNVLKNVDNRSSPVEGNVVGQGIKNQILFVNLSLSYQAFHNLFIDFLVTSRTQSMNADKYLFATMSLRYNIQKRDYEF